MITIQEMTGHAKKIGMAYEMTLLPLSNETDMPHTAISILLFLAHMNRQEMDAFWDNLIATKEENEKGIKGILHSLRRGDNEFAVLFISGIIRPIDEILPIVRKTAEVKRILEVAIYHVSAKEFAIDFLYWDNTQDS